MVMFFLSCLMLSAFPGANNILCLSHGTKSGFTKAFLGGLGRFPAYFLMILTASLIFFSILAINNKLIAAIQLLGSCYMLYIGINFLLAAKSNEIDNYEASSRNYFSKEFITALSNPKAILVFTAFFPNFIASDHNVFYQFLTLGIIAMIAEFLMMICYALAGAYIGSTTIPKRYVSGISGAFIVIIACKLLVNSLYSFI